MNDKAVLIKVTDGTAPKIVPLPAGLYDIYRLLEIDCIDIVKRRINGKAYRVICDDMGWLKGNPVPSGISDDGRIAFVGNLLICSGKDSFDGELVGLSEAEAQKVVDCVYYTQSGYMLFGIQ